MSPSDPTVTTGQTVQFTLTLNGASYSTALTWAVNGTTGGNATIGTISSTGLYTAPSVVPSPNTVTVSANQQGASTTGTTLTASAATQVTITAGSGSGTGTTPTASIAVNPNSIATGQNATLTWSSTNAQSCTINGLSAFNGANVNTAGSMQVSPATTTIYTLNCVGATGSNPASASATLTVQSSTTPPPPAYPIAISIYPASINLVTGASQQFVATVSNDTTNEGVTWTSSSTLGSNLVTLTAFTASYTAPSVTQITSFQITATSKADPSASSSATITILPPNQSPPSSGPPQAGINPPSLTMLEGTSQEFAATVSGSGVTNQDQQFSWQLRAAEGVSGDIGTLTVGANSSTAVYQAPNNLPAQITVQLIATSVSFPSAPPGYSTVIVATSTYNGYVKRNKHIPK